MKTFLAMLSAIVVAGILLFAVFIVYVELDREARFDSVCKRAEEQGNLPVLRWCAGEVAARLRGQGR